MAIVILYLMQETELDTTLRKKHIICIMDQQKKNSIIDPTRFKVYEDTFIISTTWLYLPPSEKGP